MRLVCPNCDAEYEVDDAAIPREGRDVQCSNCGHAWFQVHPEVEADREAEADLYEAPEGAVAPAVDAVEDEPAPEPVVASVTEPVAEPVDAAEPAPPVMVPDEDEDDEPATIVAPVQPAEAEAPPPKARSLDETVLAVLREEAEREAAARKAETAAQPALESQTEMPMAPPAEEHGGGMAAAVRRIARMRGVAAEPAPAAEPEPAPAPKSRGQMFPAIEEINSTLRATGDRGQDEDDAIVDTLPDLTRKSGGFRRGFLTLIGIGVLIVILYVLAPVIAAKVPALEGTAKAYVAGVDAARVWLDATLRALVAKLKDLAGGQGG